MSFRGTPDFFQEAGPKFDFLFDVFFRLNFIMNKGVISEWAVQVIFVRFRLAQRPSSKWVFGISKHAGGPGTPVDSYDRDGPSTDVPEYPCGGKTGGK